jgi:hypothetical protein
LNALQGIGSKIVADGNLVHSCILQNYIFQKISIQKKPLPAASAVWLSCFGFEKEEIVCGANESVSFWTLKAVIQPDIFPGKFRIHLNLIKEICLKIRGYGPKFEIQRLGCGPFFLIYYNNFDFIFFSLTGK